MLTDPTLLRTAYHEAAHAVAVVLQARPLVSVSIRPEGSYLGVTWHRPGDYRNQWREVVDRLGDVEGHLLVILAGHIGEELAPGLDRTACLTGADKQRAEELALWLSSGDARAAGQYLDTLLRLVRYQLHDHDDAVHALAAMLVERIEIDGPEAERIIRSRLAA